jgi:hypothetical protein
MVYIVAFVAAIALAGDLTSDSPKDLIRLWPVLLGAIAIAYLGTTSIIARFGNATGSIYFLPTVAHAAMILVLVIVVAFGLWR